MHTVAETVRTTAVVVMAVKK